MAGDPLVQVVVLVTDLDSARHHMESIGLTAVEGGRHPGRGTANLIVPFNHAGQYLELLAVVDEDEARASPQGRPVVEALAARGPGPARWSVEPDDIAAAGRRTQHTVEHRQRVLMDGTTIRWRAVAVDRAWAEPWRCSFMAWDDPDHHPAHTDTLHANGATGFARLVVDTPDPTDLMTWLGGTAPAGVDIARGSGAGPVQLLLASPQGDIPIT